MHRRSCASTSLGRSKNIRYDRGMRRFRKSQVAAGITAALVAPHLPAVSLNPDGLGQALIYPYYTVRSVGGNAFHTYLTVGNSASDAKALRVRLREGRAGREVLSFNLYLGPNDLWAGALVPTADGARLLTTDASCTDPPFANGALELRREAFLGAMADGFGDTLDRTREGYVEILEMATLFGESAAAIGHNVSGLPIDCAFIRGATQPLVARPSGGIWGTLTLINVNGGQDFTLDATALADLASRPYFRPPADPYPDFAAAEIDPVSVVRKRGFDLSRPFPLTAPDNANFLYRSTWSRPVDAVSAVLMSTTWMGDFVLDDQTLSATDFIVTAPTRHHYTGAASPTPPFHGQSGWSRTCMLANEAFIGDKVGIVSFNRESQRSFDPCDTGFPTPCSANNAALCASAGVASMVVRERPASESGISTVVGSTTGGLARGDWHVRTLGIPAATNGVAYLFGASQGATTTGLASLPDSTRINLDSGQVLTGRHTFFGLPVIGFYARTFNNGQLACAGASCQGTYGSAISLRHFRVVVP
jgi:hypothetical protein